jgi:methyl-accepting chemotaxis protein
MWPFNTVTSTHETNPQDINPHQQDMDAIRQHVAMIEFSPDGTILAANALFLTSMGYQAAEIIGKHHRIFCLPSYSASAEYSHFWQKLNQGKAQDGLIERLHKSGQHLWLDATYLPVVHQGRTIKIIKIAQDVTQKTQQAQLDNAILTALDATTAVIEFSPDGTILGANANFLKTMGMNAQALFGQHHKVLCFDDFYQHHPHFWQHLAQGKAQCGRFRRKHADGHEIWLEATYNPIRDNDDKIFKVIKFATDITRQHQYETAVGCAANVANDESAQTVNMTSSGAEILQQAVTNSGTIATQVNKTLELLQLLAEESKQISNIVTTIRSIADQTNLLALNAAIEAARAGEQGRGFAVVADEVRNLAARTSDSTKEIEQVVSKNVQFTQNAMAQMNSIHENSDKAEALVLEAANAMVQIRQGAERVAQSIAALAQTQQH